MKKYIKVEFWDGKTRTCPINPETDIYKGILTLLADIARNEGAQMHMIDVKEARVYFAEEGGQDATQ